MKYKEVENRIRAYIARRTKGTYVEGSLQERMVWGFRETGGKMHELAYVYQVQFGYHKPSVETRCFRRYDVENDPKFDY